MANRRASSVTVDGFNPRPLMSDGLAPVARPDGSDEMRVAGQFGQLAAQAGKWADDAAQIEGKRDGLEAGNDPSFRPTGSTTLRGAAFEKAAIDTYTNNLDAKVRSQMTDLFQQHQNNPAALKAALDGLKAQVEKDDLFPEIRGSFNAAFERMRLPFQVRALDNLETRQRDEARASALAANAAGATQREQQILGDPLHPATRASVEDSLDADDARERKLVEAGAMTATQAATNRIKRRRDAETTLIGAAADKLDTPDKVRKFREKMTEDFRGGKTKLDDVGFNEADAALRQREQQLLTRGKQGLGTLSKSMDAVVKQFGEGIPISGDEVSVLREQAQHVPGGDELVRRFDRRLMLARATKMQSPAEIEAAADRIAREAAEGPGLTTEQGEDVEFLRAAAKTKRTALAKDPLAYAARNRLVDVPGLSIPGEGLAPAIAVQMRQRVAAGQAAAEAQKTPVRYLTGDDKVALQSVMAEGGDKALQMVRGIVEGAGPQAPAILKELGGDAPELAHAGDLMAQGGPAADRAARDVAKAIALRRVAKKSSGVTLPNPPKEARDVIDEEMGATVVNNPETRAQVLKTARAIFQARAFDRHVDPNTPEGKELYREALREATGSGVVDGVRYGGVAKYRQGSWYWGSNYKVPIPATVRTDRFRDVIDAIRDEDLGGATNAKGQPISAKDVRGAVPVLTPSGGYAFTTGDPADPKRQFLGRPGAPLILDLDKLEPDLRRRVPGAYFGGDTPQPARPAPPPPPPKPAPAKEEPPAPAGKIQDRLPGAGS